eukprot:gene12231-5213_t
MEKAPASRITHRASRIAHQQKAGAWRASRSTHVRKSNKCEGRMAAVRQHNASLRAADAAARASR